MAYAAHLEELGNASAHSRPIAYGDLETDEMLHSSIGLAVALLALPPSDPCLEWERGPVSEQGAERTAAQEPTKEYFRAVRLFNDRCGSLEAEFVEFVRESVQTQTDEGVPRATILRDGRNWCEDEGLDDKHKNCVSAIVRLEHTPMYAPAPPPPVIHPSEVEDYLQYATSRRDRELDACAHREDWGCVSWIVANNPPWYPRLVLKLNEAGYLPPITVVQVTGPAEFLATTGVGDSSDGVDFMLQGLDTSKLVDGQKLSSISEIFRVTRTASYTTVLGATRTVLLVEPLHLPYVPELPPVSDAVAKFWKEKLRRIEAEERARYAQEDRERDKQTRKRRRPWGPRGSWSPGIKP